MSKFDYMNSVMESVILSCCKCCIQKNRHRIMPCRNDWRFDLNFMMETY